MPGKGKRRGSGGSNFMKTGLAHNKQAASDRERRQDRSDRADRQRNDDGGWFEKHRSSVNEDTGTPQPDLLFGEKGTKGGHIAVDANGNLQYMRDADGTVVYDRSEGIGEPPPGWED